MLLATILSLVLFLQKETACSSNEVIVQEDSAIKLFARGRGFLQRLSATRKKEINERIVNCMVAIRGKISWKIIRANFLRYLFLHEQEERQIFNLKTNLFLQQWTARDNGDIESSSTYSIAFLSRFWHSTFTINVPQAIKISFCSTRNDPLDRERGRTRNRG